MGAVAKPKLYHQLASWWPILSPPGDYAEEAAFFRKVLIETPEQAPRTILELGSGGGNNASYLKAQFQMVLVDRSPEMIAVSRGLNPECEHFEGDMRTVRLGRQFDAVFVHDAICYIVNESDLRKVIETAYVHCKPGGVALFVPDHVDYAPMFDDVMAIGEGCGKVEILLHQQDRETLVFQPPDHTADLLDNNRRKTLGRLVEQEKIGASAQHPGDCQHLLLAAGEFGALTTAALA